jgi:hypothetical protein
LKELLDNQAAVTEWWATVHDVDKDHWLSARAIHRHWKEATAEAKFAAYTSDGPNYDDDNNDEPRRTARDNSRRRRTPATERITIRTPRGASAAEIARPSADRMEARMAEEAERESLTLVQPASLPDAIRAVLALIDDPTQWPETRRTETVVKRLRKALCDAIDLLNATAAETVAQLSSCRVMHLEHDSFGGRPPHEPTDALRNVVRLCAALGKNQETTAALAGVSVETLFKYYRVDFEYGKIIIDLAVTSKLVSAATAREHTGPTVDAAKFWAKTQMGFREGSVVELHKTQGDGALSPVMTTQEAVHAYLDSLKMINLPTSAVKTEEH